MKPVRLLLILLFAAFFLAAGAEAARAADVSQETTYLWHGENWRGQGQYMNQDRHDVGALFAWAA